MRSVASSKLLALSLPTQTREREFLIVEERDKTVIEKNERMSILPQ